ncbi:unnamed protein product, partial [Chrysoparadoxa australica]
MLVEAAGELVRKTYRENGSISLHNPKSQEKISKAMKTSVLYNKAADSTISSKGRCCLCLQSGGAGGSLDAICEDACLLCERCLRVHEVIRMLVEAASQSHHECPICQAELCDIKVLLGKKAFAANAEPSPDAQPPESIACAWLTQEEAVPATHVLKPFLPCWPLPSWPYLGRELKRGVVTGFEVQVPV